MANGCGSSRSAARLQRIQNATSSTSWPHAGYPYQIPKNRIPQSEAKPATPRRTHKKRKIISEDGNAAGDEKTENEGGNG